MSSFIVAYPEGVESLLDYSLSLAAGERFERSSVNKIYKFNDFYQQNECFERFFVVFLAWLRY